jgi:integrase
MFTLTLDQVDVKCKTIFLERTKNGDKRQVPMTSVAIKVFRTYAKHVENGTRGMEGFRFEAPDPSKPWTGRVFPWWNGKLDKDELERITYLLSKQWGRVFEAALCPDFRFHDARHEATSRFFERTTLSDLQIAKITGHKDLRMLARYANLRGSNLAERLW